MAMASQDELRNKDDTMPMKRVKLYHLSDAEKWEDHGIGHVSVHYLEGSKDQALFVFDEEDDEVILQHPICLEDIYRKQESTIISWNDPDFLTEIALSFQEAIGCSYIWDHICNLQRNARVSSTTNKVFTKNSKEPPGMPPVELSNLYLIFKIVQGGTYERDQVAELLLQDQDFFKKLVALFRICEDSGNKGKLQLIYGIVRGIILLNNFPIHERIFGDGLIMDIIGCLENRPGTPKRHHRKFLREDVIFKEPIPITNALVLSKIHQNYRLKYIKDVIFANILEDKIDENINSIIHSNNAAIISFVKNDSKLSKELLARLNSPTTSVDSKKILLQFLHEFCMLSKSLQEASQLQFFRDLVNEGIFDIIAAVLGGDDHKLVLTGTEILILLCNLDQKTLVSQITRPEVDQMGLLVNNMLKDFEDDVHFQFVEIIRRLLDTTIPGPKEQLVRTFYGKHLSQLIDAITSSCPPSSGGEIEYKSMSVDMLLSICDLLGFCVLHHPYRIKCYFLFNSAVVKVWYLARRREKCLVLAAIRFMRTLVSCSDEYLVDHIVTNNLFSPIVEAFVDHGSRYNLLHSAVLEFFEYIREENMKPLLRYLVENFWNQLSKFDKFPPIRALKVAYDRLLLGGAGVRTSTTSIEEKDHFDVGSNEDGSASDCITSADHGDSEPSVSVHEASSNPSKRAGGLADCDAVEKKRALVTFCKRKLFSEGEPQLKRLQQAPKSSSDDEGKCFPAHSDVSRKAETECQSDLSRDVDMEDQQSTSGELSCASQGF